MLSPERVDVTMDEADWPIAQFEFTEKAQNSSRLVWTSDTDCTINAGASKVRRKSGEYH
jgi:hypothetical protein